MFNRPINLHTRIMSCVAVVAMSVATYCSAVNAQNVEESHNVEAVQEIVDTAELPQQNLASVYYPTAINGFQFEDEFPSETYLMYVDASSAWYRSEPVIDENTGLGLLQKGEEVSVISQEGHWCKCIVDDQVVYVHATLLVESKPQEETYQVKTIADSETPLTATLGRVQGPSGEETYYNLNMSGVCKRLKSLGYDYEYWVRDDGVKMYGDYVIVAANFDIRPIGTIVETSLGQGIVADCGEFVEENPTGIDIAVTW